MLEFKSKILTSHLSQSSTEERRAAVRRVFATGQTCRQSIRFATLINTYSQSQSTFSAIRDEVMRNQVISAIRELLNSPLDDQEERNLVQVLNYLFISYEDVCIFSLIDRPLEIAELFNRQFKFCQFAHSSLFDNFDLNETITSQLLQYLFMKHYISNFQFYSRSNLSFRLVGVCNFAEFDRVMERHFLEMNRQLAENISSSYRDITFYIDQFMSQAYQNLQQLSVYDISQFVQNVCTIATTISEIIGFIQSKSIDLTNLMATVFNIVQFLIVQNYQFVDLYDNCFAAIYSIFKAQPAIYCSNSSKFEFMDSPLAYPPVLYCIVQQGLIFAILECIYNTIQQNFDLKIQNGVVNLFIRVIYDAYLFADSQYCDQWVRSMQPQQQNIKQIYQVLSQLLFTDISLKTKGYILDVVFALFANKIMFIEKNICTMCANSIFNNSNQILNQKCQLIIDLLLQKESVKNYFLQQFRDQLVGYLAQFKDVQNCITNAFNLSEIMKLN